MHKRRVILFVTVLIAVCLSFWFFHPLPSYNTSRVEPRLLALQQPYQSIKTSYFMDGGSMGIEIIDRDGKREEFAIPSHLGDTNRLMKVFVGAIYDRHEGAVEVFDSEQTKRMLIHILASKQHRTPYDDAFLARLAERPVDFVRLLIHKWKGDYKYDRSPL